VGENAVNKDTVAVYEQAFTQTVLGDTLRPGGLDLTRRALEINPLPENARVLDVGCGAGQTVDYLLTNGQRAFGLDLSLKLLKAGRERITDLPVLQADASFLPMPAGRMDAILAECSLSVFGRLNQILNGFYRSLHADGVLILTDLYTRNPAGLRELQGQFPCGCFAGAFGQEELTASLMGAGFTRLVWEDHSEVLKSINWKTSVLDLAGPSAAGMDSMDLLLSVARARLSYFLCVAKKR
jgi:SAM-dependent methyltransferase